MRIGIDAACWANRRGYGRFTRELIKALLRIDTENEYVFFLDKETNAVYDFPDGIIRKVVDTSEPPAKAASASGHRSFTDMLRFSRAVAREDLDIFFFPSVYTYFPIINRAKKVVGIHDVIAERYPQLVFRNNRHRVFWNMKVWMALRQADFILTVSEFSKRGIVEEFNISGERVFVVKEAADPVFYRRERDEDFEDVLRRYHISSKDRVILYVGGIAPHKNIQTLVKAYASLIEEPKYKDVRLVLVGDVEKEVFLVDSGLSDLIDRLGLNESAIFTGFLEDRDLAILYNAAAVFVLPSYCEGFGLPALEAMACGTPVIGSCTTSLPEVVGNAGLFFHPDSSEELKDRLCEVLHDDGLRRELSKRAIDRAATYSWELSARQALGMFNEIVRV